MANFPTSLDSFTTKYDNTDDVMAADINDVQDAIEALEAKVGINSSAVTTSLDYKVNNFFVSGRKVYLYENAEPTGWSIVSVSDRVLAVKGGTGSYNVNGGNTGGSFTITAAQMPSHSHTRSVCTTGIQGAGGSNVGAVLGAGAFTSYSSVSSNTAGSGASTYRPAACVGIIVEKD